MKIDLGTYGDAPFLISPAPVTARGVDFLGMAQDNFNLMDACVPGMNNNNNAVRPYSLMCWAHWRFRESWQSQQRKPSDKDLQRFLEKVESLFLWSHKLHAATLHMPGSAAKVPKANSAGEVKLEFKSWGRKAANTSYMAAAQYRPSITAGLGFLRHEARSFFRMTPSGEALAVALDEVLRKNPSYPLLMDLFAEKAREEDAETLFRSWNIATTSSREAKIFAGALYNAESCPGAADEEKRSPLARRSAFIQIILELLKQSDDAQSSDALRHQLAFQRHGDGAELELADGPKAQAHRWYLLQLRQAQRQAMESLMAWMENRMLDDGLVAPEQFWRRVAEECADEESRTHRWKTIEDGIRRCLPARCNSLEAYGTYLFERPEESSFITEAHHLADRSRVGEQTSADCLYLLVLLERLLSWMPAGSFLEQEMKLYSTGYRLPLTQMRATMRKFAHRRPAEMLEHVIKSQVLSQHFAIATQRHETGKPRLRIAVEEEGFRPLVTSAMQPRPTQDRLDAMLSILASCRMIRETEDGYSL